MKNSATALMLTAISLTLAAETITNDDIIRMAKAGLSADTIELKIRYSDTSFDTSTDALIALKEAGVADATIRTIIEKQKDAPPKAVTPKTPEEPATPSSATAPPEPSSAPAASPAPAPKQTPPPAPPIAPSAAPAAQPARSTFEVTVGNTAAGATCSSGFLRIDGAGLGVTGCLGSNFRIKWQQLESACAAAGNSTAIRLTTSAGTRDVSADSATERDQIVALVRARVPALTIDSCRN